MNNKLKVSIIGGILAVTLITGYVAGYSAGKSYNKPTEQEVKQEVKTKPKEAAKEEPKEPQKVSLGMFTATAYCPCEKCCGKYALNRPLDENGNPIVYTASGAVAKSGRTIAVDPSVIPYGTKVYINGNEYIAEDTGGAIKGNKIDIYFNEHNLALAFGRQQVEVYVTE